MDNYKLASQQQLRFNTDKGDLSVEQLWSLTQNQLGALIKHVKKSLKQNEGDDELAFLNEANQADTVNQLRFEIAKDIYLTKKKEAEEKRDAADRKASNQKIMDLIQRKKEGQLEEKTVEELEAMLA